MSIPLTFPRPQSPVAVPITVCRVVRIEQASLAAVLSALPRLVTALPYGACRVVMERAA